VSEKLYFNATKLDELEKETKTVPVDGEGRVLNVMYSEEYVRGTILKLIADNRKMQEYIATVVNNYHHVLTYDMAKLGAYLVKGEAEKGAEQ
jgi:hypothetical protein